MIRVMSITINYHLLQKNKRIDIMDEITNSNYKLQICIAYFRRLLGNKHLRILLPTLARNKSLIQKSLNLKRVLNFHF